MLTKLKTIDPESLSSSKHLQLLDSIDKLRSQGIDHYISLPQIIVCGDQSSGKSSVLEAISGVSFPVKSNLCTRFPIELVLRKTAHTGIHVSIIRDKGRSRNADHGDNGSADAAFEEKLDSYDDLPGLVEGAKTAMGILSHGKAFSKDTLRIEISGPNHPHLTIVDLPGLIHSETKYQSASDIELIQDVVKKYMKKARTIILAVVSAKNDFANQIVLKLARVADPKGTRTLGVITKPDTLLPGSNNEKSFMLLARNKEIEFRLGWHVLKNMDSDTGAWTLRDRDAMEMEFFHQGAWASLPENSLGIKMLRVKLSDLLFKQIAVELPELITEIQDKSTWCRNALHKLGRPRTTLDDQRMYMIEISQNFQTLLKAAVDGNYNHSFFGNAETLSGYQKHFRAVVQNLSEDFAQDIERRGRQYQFDSSSDSEDTLGGRLLTRTDFTDRVMKLMRRSRGRELPGLFDPMIVATLFKEQSSPWADIAMAYMNKVWDAAKLFLVHLTAHVADPSTVQVIVRSIIEPKLEHIRGMMRQKTYALLKPHKEGHPITYNKSFLERIPRVRSERKSAKLASELQRFFHESSLETVCMQFDMEELHRAILASIVEQSETEHAASQALDYVEAYYEVALKRFIDDISVEVIETCLVEELDQIFSPLEIAKMSAQKISRIAGETEESRKVREDLQKQLDVLVGGIETCREHVSIQVAGPDDNEDEEKDDDDELTTEEDHVIDEQSQIIKDAEKETASETPPTEELPVPHLAEPETVLEEACIEPEESWPVPAESYHPEVEADARPAETGGFWDNATLLSKKDKKKKKRTVTVTDEA